MGMLEELSELGVDTNEAVKRFMDNKPLYEKMLKKLPGVVEEKPVLPFAQAGDFESALTNAHALKGVTGNLSIAPLFDNYKAIVDYIRLGDNNKAFDIIKDTMDIQEKIVNCIKKYSE